MFVFVSTATKKAKDKFRTRATVSDWGDQCIVPALPPCAPNAEVLREGTDVTLVGWGNQVHRLMQTADLAAQEGLSCEVIDLQSIMPWDEEAILASVEKTGRCVVAHEAPKTSGFGAELAATVQEKCFLKLEAPVQRVCGWDTPFPLAFEEFYLPTPLRVLDAVKKVTAF
ncbi:BCDH BETA1 [Symbiodinium sp. CCMP2592]|nr:BCDH BETA1 [Symbiodinium sp. CCMP2592]